jgi:hypothetical protein
LLLAAPAALAIAAAGWSRRGALRSLGSGGAWVVFVGAIAFALSIYAQPQGGGSRPDGAGAQGVRVVQAYDLAGAAARADLPMPHLDRFDPLLDDALRKAAREVYTPQRVDTLNGPEEFSKHLKAAPSSVLQAEWLDLIRNHPGLYLQVRADVFRWVLTTPDIDACLPVHVGFVGPEKTLASLKMESRSSLKDRRLYNYVTWFLDTPAYSHLTFGCVVLAVGVLLLFRREPADLAMAALMWGALGFTATFFVISLACDYRYLYLLDMSAVVGLLYVALDPRPRSR